jgi:hypothetical protein
VGFATSDTACESGFRNNLWVNVGAGGDSNVFNFDWINAFLVTAIRANSSGGFSTVLIKDNLSNYIWDTPLSGSNDCATFRGPGDHFGYSVFNLSCNTNISHAGMVLIGPSDGVPQASVGCVLNTSGPAAAPTDCEKHPDLPECIPD